MLQRDSDKVVDHTKSHEDREVLLTDAALELIEVARVYQEEHSCKCEYIFSTTDEALSYAETNILLRKYCKRLDILYRSSHKSRKTYISSLIDAGININTIRSYAGHADERTTYFNYCFDRAPMQKRRSFLKRLWRHLSRARACPRHMYPKSPFCTQKNRVLSMQFFV